MRHVTYALLAAACLFASGCAGHHHNHHHHLHRTVTVLDAEHGKPDVVIVHRRPGPDRRCWDHGNHWHCRKL